MYLLRNKEIKKFVFQIVFFTLLGCVIGFFIAPAAAVLLSLPFQRTPEYSSP